MSEKRDYLKMKKAYKKALRRNKINLKRIKNKVYQKEMKFRIRQCNKILNILEKQKRCRCIKYKCNKTKLV